MASRAGYLVPLAEAVAYLKEHDEARWARFVGVDGYASRPAEALPYGALKRLEIARAEMARALDPDVNARLIAALKALGYQYVSLDLQGYRLGSLNEALRLRPVS